MVEDALYELLQSRPFGVLVTLKRDGRPQLSNVLHYFDRGEGVIRVSVTDGRAKTANLRRDPRATYHVSSEDGWSYAVAEATADLSDVTSHPHDDTADELVQLYRNLRGEHPDWDEYRAAMVAEGRLVLRLQVDRVYGMAG
ncbi:PPOX class F420-dependent oxidoreductase [Actinokineospora xionganensis]|uniref:PPOX class F420-dependent oxidoreductase n=1 Tax=Actinokineospora xionganensis TaxID=2684470 RepID=A0ABR7KZM7_9PSEU|nr:PPOX class F420-dependent oxidoreductase [Actinokineospora xionganensis]MBC6445718.1 PPOX class F420-dependent oxidoreductase [Actinokineospora xionganensis]